ncbi:MAG: hypothetical protein F4118_00325 [Acidimicrobiaceae bacterium]|nr:hypothetical protein [Candidatus Poribacteria bacterium]MYI34867.1 hypothetical protein [Acidimicrobiaceae bacterium]
MKIKILKALISAIVFPLCWGTALVSSPMFKTLLKAIGIATSIILGVQLLFHGGFWLFMKIPEPVRYPIMLGVSILISVPFIYIALKIREKTRRK